MDLKEASNSTKNKFAEELDENGDVIIVEKPEAIAAECDAMMNTGSNMNSLAGTQATGALIVQTGVAQSSLETPAGSTSLANSKSKGLANGSVMLGGAFKPGMGQH